jgi:hypothetical protein
VELFYAGIKVIKNNYLPPQYKENYGSKYVNTIHVLPTGNELSVDLNITIHGGTLIVKVNAKFLSWQEKTR